MQEIYCDAFGGLNSLHEYAEGLRLEGFQEAVRQARIDTIDESKLNRKGSGADRFSMASPVEEARNLIAMHNLTEDKLLKSLRMGGFPMPSIAVTRADIPHTNFGPITLVMSKDTVDPKANRKNVVYSADAWTPTFPRIEFEANPETERNLKDKYYELSKKYGRDITGELYNLAYDLERKLETYGGADGVIENLKSSTGMMQAFLADTGKGVVEPKTVTKVARLDENIRKRYDYILEAVGPDPFLELLSSKEGKTRAEKMAATHDRMLKYRGTILSVWAEYLNKQDSSRSVEEYLEMLDASEMRSSVSKDIHAIVDYLKNGDTKTTTETAIDKQDIIDKASGKEYENWLHGLLDGAEKSRGVYNNTELFTRTGNRRSFQQTHWPVTLENIVKAMATKNGGDTVASDAFGISVKTLRAAASNKFKSIADMHKNESRLQNLTKAESEAINDELSNRYTSLLERIANQNGGYKENQLIEDDRFGHILMEIAKKGKYSTAQMEAVFREYGLRADADTVAETKQLLADISMMPVNLFEAKPERVVGLNEILQAVIPNDSSAELRTALSDNGVPFREYSDQDQRLQIVNGVEGAKFSRVNEDSPYNGHNLSTDKELYSWDFLVNLHDMEITKVPDLSAVSGENGKINRPLVLENAVKNAQSVGMDRAGKIYIRNSYTDRMLNVRTETIRHSLNGDPNRLRTNARLNSVAGELIKNAVPINSLNDTAEGVSGTYAMAAFAKGNDGREFVSIITVEQRENEIIDFEIFDSAHSISGRNKKASEADTKSQGVYPINTGKITIADLLGKVNSFYRSILSDDVLHKLGETRPEVGEYTGKAKFSRVTEEQDREYLELAKEPEKNEKRLKAMVLDAGRRAGYTERVFHGTKNFGFTEFDTRKSKGIAYFTSSSQEIAETYSGTGVQRIAGSVPVDIDLIRNASDEKLLQYLQKYISKDTKMVKGESGTKFDIPEPFFAGYPASRQEIEFYMGIMFGGSGTYELLANTDGMLEVDCRGSVYSNINGVTQDGETIRGGTTDEITSQAKAKGYSGVIFRNISDIGPIRTYAQNGDVLAFFHSSQLKSADPVTYDDAGNVIPLSERFNTSNDDIRFSRVRDSGNNFSDSSIDKEAADGQNIDSEVLSNDDRGIQSISGEQERGAGIVGRRNQQHADSTQEIKKWRDVDIHTRRRLRRAIKDKVSHGPSAYEAYAYLLRVIGMTDDSQLTLSAYNRGIDKMSEEIYNALVSNPLAAEDKYGNLLGDIEQIEEIVNSQKDSDQMFSRVTKTASELNAENKRLRKMVEHWKGQTKLTETATARKEDVAQAAREIVAREAYAGIKPFEIRDDLQALADYIVSNGNGYGVDSDEINDRAYRIAKTVVDSASNNDAQELMDITLKAINGRQINIGPATEFGSREHARELIRRARAVGLRFTTQGGESIDSIYQGLAEDMSLGFDPEIMGENAANQAEYLVSTMEGWQDSGLSAVGTVAHREYIKPPSFLRERGRFFAVRPVSAHSIGCKSRSRPVAGRFSQRQGCPS